MVDYYYPGPAGKFRKLATGAEVFDNNPVYLEPVLSLPNLVESAPAVLTRPANVTPYAVGDAITDAGGSATLMTVSLQADTPVILQALNLSTTDTGLGTTISVEAYIYNTAITPAADNAVFAFNAAGLVGIMSGTFRGAADGGAALLTPVAGSFLLAKPMAGNRTFNVILRALSAFTPSGNGTTVTAVMKAVQGA